MSISLGNSSTQGRAKFLNQGANATSTITISVTAGRSVVLGVATFHDNGGSTRNAIVNPTITDSQGNTWTKTIEQNNTLESPPRSSAVLYHCASVASTGTLTITLTSQNTPNAEDDYNYFAAEVVGLNTSSMVNKTGGAYSTSYTITSFANQLSATTTQTDTIVFGAWAVPGHSNPQNLTSPSGWTQLDVNQNALGSVGFWFGYKILSATEQTSATLTFSTVNNGAAATFAAFNAMPNYGTLSTTVANETVSAIGTNLDTGAGVSGFSNATTSASGGVAITGSASPSIANLSVVSRGFDPNDITWGATTGKKTVTLAGSSTNFSFPADYSPTAGSAVVVTINGFTSSPSTTTFSASSLSDNQGNTYVKINSVYDATQRTGTETWAAFSVTSSGTFTVTVNFTETGSYNNATISADEFRNILATSQPDQSASSNTSSPVTVTTGATHSLKELVLAQMQARPTRDSNNGTITYPAGYRNLWGETLDSRAVGSADFQVVSATGTQSATYDFSTNTGNMGVLVTTLYSSLAVYGTATDTIDNLTGSLAGTAIAGGTLSKTLDNVTGSGTAQAIVGCTLSASIGNITGSSAGTNLTHGAGASGFNNLALSSGASELDNGALTLTLDSPTLSSTASVITHGTVSSSVGTLTSSSAGTVSITGSSSASIANLTLSSATGVLNTGSLTSSISTLTSSTSVGVLIVGTTSASLDSITGSSTAKAIAGGTLAKTLAAITASSDGLVVSHGTLSAAIDPLTIAADATVLVTSTGAASIGSLTSSSAGTIGVAGSATPTLANLTLSSAGTESITGTGSASYDNLTLSSAGTESITGTGSASYDNLTLSAATTNTTNSTLTSSLSNLTMSGVGAGLVSASLSLSAGIPALSTAGTVRVAGTSSPTLANLTSNSTGTVLVSGSETSTFDAITSTTSGGIAVVGSLTATVTNLTSSSAGTVSLTGTATPTIAAITVRSDGFIGVIAVGAASFAIPNLTAALIATNPVVGTSGASVGTLTLTDTGTVSNHGTVSTSVGTIAGSLVTGVLNQAVATNSVGALTKSLQTQVLNYATQSNSIGLLTGSSAGVVGATGTFVPTLSDLTSSSAGVVVDHSHGLDGFGNFELIATMYMPLDSNSELNIGAIIPEISGSIPLYGYLDGSIGPSLLATTRPLAFGNSTVTIPDLGLLVEAALVNNVALVKVFNNLTLTARETHPYLGVSEIPPGSGNYLPSPPGFGVSTTLARLLVTPAGTFTVANSSYITLQDGSVIPVESLQEGDVIKTWLMQVTVPFNTGTSVSNLTFTNDKRALYLEVTSLSDPGYFSLETSIVPVFASAPDPSLVCTCALTAAPDAASCGQQFFVNVSSS